MNKCIKNEYYTVLALNFLKMLKLLKIIYK